MWELFLLCQIYTKIYTLHLKFDLMLLKNLILRAKLENSVDSTALSPVCRICDNIYAFHRKAVFNLLNTSL